MYTVTRMQKRKWGIAIVVLGFLIVGFEAYISYSIVNACLHAKGIFGCNGLYGLEYFFAYPFALLLIRLFALYQKKYSAARLSMQWVMFLFFIVITLFVVIVPGSLVGQVQQAALRGEKAFGVDFKQYVHNDHISPPSLQYCDQFLISETCKIDYIKSQSLGIEACNDLGEFKYRCNFEILKQSSFVDVTARTCFERLYIPGHDNELDYQWFLIECAAAVAKNTQDQSACKILQNVESPLVDDQPDELNWLTGEVRHWNYHRRCLEAYRFSPTPYPVY